MAGLKWRQFWPMSGLGTVALAYVALDYWRERASWLPRSYSEIIQPGLWGCLAILALCEAPTYKHLRAELRAAPKFVACALFLISAIAVEVIMVQFATVVMGLDWHSGAAPLPDTGQWALLAANEALPQPIVALLRMRLIELHHFLMLFIMLAFSVLFGYADAPGLALGARYCLAMGAGRLLRVLTFSSTLLPSPRPWCAGDRFWGSAGHPHPWAQRYHVPYAGSHFMLQELLRRDTCFAMEKPYPPEYAPDWGVWQILVSLVRPADPAELARAGGHASLAQGAVVRPGGGCNDLAFSGHMLVAVLTACAWQETFPGATSVIIWLLTIHSGQREIRERHHYSVDVVAAFYVGILLWKATAFVWSPGGGSRRVGSSSGMSGGSPCSREALGKRLADKSDLLFKMAKEGDLQAVREVLEQAQGPRGADGAHDGGGGGGGHGYKDGEEQAPPHWLYMAGIIVACVSLVLFVFYMCVGG
eukprot:jgi/Mesen1/7942/ME000422S07099